MGADSTVEVIDESAWDDESPTNVVANAIAMREETAVTDLPPLETTIATEAMNAMLRSSESISLSFTYLGYEVTATGEGVVKISKVTE